MTDVEWEKIVQLERAINPSGQQGSFGFSILGGAGTKFPAVVCEVDPGGPADRTGKVFVGDHLAMLNGENLEELRPAELVQRIRTAPSPSIFVLLKDENLQQQVLALLRKQERRAQARQRSGAVVGSPNVNASSVEVQKLPTHKKVSLPALSNASGAGMETEDHRERRRKKHDRIIEVEPSVNIGDTGDIVQVRDNKIIGRVNQQVAAAEWVEPSGGPGVSPRQGRHKTPPSPASQEHRMKLLGEKLEESPPRQTRGSSPGNVSANSTGDLDLEKKTAIVAANSTVKSTSLDSFSHGSGGSSIGSPHTSNLEITQDNLVAEGLNGDVRSFSDSSGITSLSDNAIMTPYEEQSKASRLSELGSKLASATATPSPSLSESTSNHTEDSGVTVHIPRWPTNLEARKPRGSLAEDVLVSELEKKPLSQLALNTKLPTPTEENAELAQKQDSPTRNESPKLMPDPELRDHLMKMYRTPSRSSSKKHHDPYADAVTLARKLYMLDGFKKSEVAEKLSDTSEFGETVAKEYLKFFEFEGMALDEAVRHFLSFFSLTGESQQRERVMAHFSDRFLHCNPDHKVFTSIDVVHGLTVALLLLNTDLHAEHAGRKITFAQFASSLKGIEVKAPKDMLKKMFDNIKRKPFRWAEDDQEPTSAPQSSEEEDDTMRTYHVTIPGTFVEVELPGKATVYKEGFVARKNVMEGSHKKVPRGKRQWKAYYGFLKGFLMYFAPPQGELHLDNTSSAVSITHCLAMRAHDYRKRGAVVRVTTSDWHVFLLQTSNWTDMQQWIGAINKAAARYSSPPLAAPVSSSSKFQRPTFPITPTKNSLEQQIEAHDSKVKQLEKELQEHHAYKPTGRQAKHGSLQDWFDKYEFLQFEINRFRIYYASLTTDSVVDFNAPLPSGLVPSPSINTLATPGTPEDEVLFSEYRAGSPPSSPRSGAAPHIAHSPLLNSKKRS